MAVSTEAADERLSPWWKRGVAITLISGFAVLGFVAVMAYHDAPPIPDRVVDSSGTTLFTGDDIRTGQAIFLKYGLMDNGTIWGHGAYLGPDFSATYLHNVALHFIRDLAETRFGRPYDALSPQEKAAVEGETGTALKLNRYDARTHTLTLLPGETRSFEEQVNYWVNYFSVSAGNGGLSPNLVSDPTELRQLTTFFEWAAWASVTERPGTNHSYTNNFPFDPMAGNRPTGEALLWSAFSLIFLLAGTGLVLFAFGKFGFLGWRTPSGMIHRQLMVGVCTEVQQATLKFFVFAALLFLAQAMVGGAVAHYRADPRSFYGVDLAAYFPSNLLRVWHLQLAIFWIATTYVAGALFVAASLGGRDPARQVWGVNLLFGALCVVVLGSLFGEWAGIRRALPELWFWFGNQGWEYLELGRAWQILLIIGLLFWFWLLVRAVAPALRDPGRREITVVFLVAALAIPIFYLPALFFDASSHFSVVDMWRFWIVHLWVEGFFEFFVTVIVATVLLQIGVVARLTAIRVVYLDAILYFGGGVIGTGHHWYWTGQTEINMALSAAFSALEVVPLTLLTLDAWDFIKLAQIDARDQGQEVATQEYRWTFYFLMAVGFWNFTGAGVFGFLINLPIISYFEAGTILTPNHGHAAMMGVFGMLGVGLMALVGRHVTPAKAAPAIERCFEFAFWGLNVGLLMMVVLSLFPGGVLQVRDVVHNGYWHARSLAYTAGDLARLFEWLRFPGDLIFIFLGALPVAFAEILAYRSLFEQSPASRDITNLGSE
ncbi:MAG: cbb3-type cytochrome c oxidase subunit I [Methylocystis sp.]